MHGIALLSFEPHDKAGSTWAGGLIHQYTDVGNWGPHSHQADRASQQMLRSSGLSQERLSKLGAAAMQMRQKVTLGWDAQTVFRRCQPVTVKDHHRDLEGHGEEEGAWREHVG